MKRWQSILLGLVVSGLTLAYALNGNDLSRLGGELARGRYLFILPCILLVVLGLALRGMRWRFLLNNRLNAEHSFHITNISYFFNSFMPFRLGEVARAYLVTRLKPPIPMFTALSSVVVERLVDLLMVVILTALAFGIGTGITSPQVEAGARISGLIAIAGLLILGFLASRRRLSHWLVEQVVRILPFLRRVHLVELTDRVLDGIAPLGSPRGITGTLFWTVLAWTASVVAGYVLLYVFYDNPTPIAAILMITIASIAIALPAVPGSVGPFEAAIILGLQIGGMVDPALGLPQERAFAFAVLLHVLTTLIYAGLGYFGLLRERVTLGEVFRAARQVASRKTAESPASPANSIQSAPSAPGSTDTI